MEGYLKIKKKYEKYFSLLNEKQFFETKSSDVAGNLQKYAYNYEERIGIMPLFVSYNRRKKLFIIVKNPYVVFKLKRRSFRRSYILVLRL